MGAALRVAFPLVFPLVALAGTRRLGARGTALLLLALAAPALVQDVRRRRAAGGAPAPRGAVGVSLATGALLACAALLDDDRFMLAYPVLVNGALLAWFAGSLRGTPIVETFARLQAPDLTGAEIRYCRGVTQVWSLFFAANGAAAALLGALAPRAWWALYTGALSYGLVGLVFASEYVVRKARFGRFGRGPVDRLLALLLRPPAPTP
jgi:uncharacterized membrane protein